VEEETDLFAMAKETPKYKERIRRGDRLIVDTEAEFLQHLDDLYSELLPEMLNVVMPLVDQLYVVLGDERHMFPPKIVVAKTEEVLGGWCRTLLNPNDPTAGDVGRKFLQAGWGQHEPPVKFWRTALGQLIFARDGFPLRAVSITEATAILERPYIQSLHYRIKTGQLELVGIKIKGLRYLTRETVYKLWHYDKREARKREEKRLADIEARKRRGKRSGY